VQLWCVRQSGEKRTRSEKCDHFLLPQHFCYHKFLTERCTANETLKPWLLTLSIGNSIKARAPGQNNTMIGRQKLSLLDTVFLDFFFLSSQWWSCQVVSGLGQECGHLPIGRARGRTIDNPQRHNTPIYLALRLAIGVQEIKLVQVYCIHVMCVQEIQLVQVYCIHVMLIDLNMNERHHTRLGPRCRRLWWFTSEIRHYNNRQIMNERQHTMPIQFTTYRAFVPTTLIFIILFNILKNLNHGK
jgi:hypothetical protein